MQTMTRNQIISALFNKLPFQENYSFTILCILLKRASTYEIPFSYLFIRLAVSNSMDQYGVMILIEELRGITQVVPKPCFPYVDPFHHSAFLGFINHQKCFLINMSSILCLFLL